MPKVFKTHITNSALLQYDPSEWFPIRQEGEVINKDEFISLQMRRFNLKTSILVRRALSSIGE